jgi:hypothetical protein
VYTCRQAGCICILMSGDLIRLSHCCALLQRTISKHSRRKVTGFSPPLECDPIPSRYAESTWLARRYGICLAMLLAIKVYAFLCPVIIICQPRYQVQDLRYGCPRSQAAWQPFLEPLHLVPLCNTSERSTINHV